jgi:hypothetical protein
MRGTFGRYRTATRSTVTDETGAMLRSFASKEAKMDQDKSNNTALYVAVYESVDSAKADMDDIEQLHEEDLVGKFDAAVVDNENGKPHIVKRFREARSYRRPRRQSRRAVARSALPGNSSTRAHQHKFSGQRCKPEHCDRCAGQSKPVTPRPRAGQPSVGWGN